MSRKIALLMGFLGFTFLVTLFQNVPSTQAKISTEDARRAEIVQNGDYDVVVLTENMQAAVGQDVYALLTNAYSKEEVLTWSVQEKDNTNYVYAYPFELADGQTRQASAKTAATRTAFAGLINPQPQSIWMCNRLYENSNFGGTQVQLCNDEGGSAVQYSRLDYYGFDNKASSYYEDRPSGTVKIYDSWYFGSLLDTIIADTYTFNSGINDRASSAIGYF